MRWSKATGKLVKRILRDNGFEKLREGKGDHEIWWNPQTRRQVTVDGGTRSRYLAQETLKQTGCEGKASPSDGAIRLYGEQAGEVWQAHFSRAGKGD